MRGQPAVLRVYDIIGGPLAVAADDGQLVCDALGRHLAVGQGVHLSFAGVMPLTGAFVYAAIGQIYESVPESKIRALLMVMDINPEDRAIAEQAVRNARAYYTDPKSYDAVWMAEGVSHD